MTIPEGVYSAKAFECTPGRTNAGDKMLGVLFRVESGDYAGQVVQWTAFFSAREGRDGKTGKERSMESMKACGWDGSADLTTMYTNTVSITVKHKEHEGKVYPEVSFVNKARAPRVQNPMSAKDFIADLTGQVADPSGFDPDAFGADDVGF